MKRIFVLLMCTAMAAVMLEGCSGKSSESADGRVYYLNFKPEVAQIWQEAAKKYTEETGVEVKVMTAASGTYEATLASEVAKSEAPTIFQINGPVGYSSWKDYCADLSGTDLYSWLIDKEVAISSGDGVYGIPFAVEGYGIIYNKAIMDRYFALDKAVAGSMEDIINFASLKAVVEDMTLRKTELGIDGVFASTSFRAGEDWRWQTHLANIPVYYELSDDGVMDKDEISFKYSDKFKNIFDLYINNSCTEPGMLSTKSVDDSMTEFARGRVAMVQNGNWAWSQIAGTDGNTVEAGDVRYLPIYTGMAGEESQGICIGTENFICVNSKVSDKDREASVAFLEWLYSSETGKDFVINKFGFITPFSTFSDEEGPDDPLAGEVLRYMEDTELTSIPWNFTTFPSQTFKDNLGASLLSYCQGQKDWQSVVDDMTADWAAEKKNAIR